MTNSTVSHKVLALDVGGTKVASAIIDSQAQIYDRKEIPVRCERGKEYFLHSIVELVKPQLMQFNEVKRFAIGSAGPLLLDKGAMINPTNFLTQGHHWGEVPLLSFLEKSLGIPGRLDNDAVCALQAERWLGHLKGIQNGMVMTLGTGVGIGILAENSVFRARGKLHPEASHIFLNWRDQSRPDNDGNYGTIEAYLGGKHLNQIVEQQLGSGAIIKDVFAASKDHDNEFAVQFTKNYADALAAAINAYVVLFAPEVVVLAGSISLSAEYFLDDCREKLLWHLRYRREGVDLLPKVVVSALDNSAGLLGAAYLALC